MTNKTVELCRSFSQKVQDPKNRYVNSDYFCSAKMEVAEKDVKKTSEKLDNLVQEEVRKSIEKRQLENGVEKKEEITYEPVRIPTKEEAEALQKEQDRIIAEGETETEKEKRWEAEQSENPVMSPKDL